MIIVDQTQEHTIEVTKYIREIRNFLFVKYIQENIANLPNARNAGIKAADGEIILFLDDDVILHKDLFKNLLNNFRNNDICSVVGLPLLKNESGENILLENDNFLKKLLKGILRGIYCKEKSSVITSWGLAISNREKCKAGIAETGRGCIMSFRRSVFDAVGFFDINYQGNALREETDLFVRIKKAKMKVYFNPNIKVDHIMANTGGCRYEKTEEYWQTYFNNQFYYYRKNFGFSKLYIEILLFLDIIKLLKSSLKIKYILDRSYKRAVNICG